MKTKKTLIAFVIVFILSLCGCGQKGYSQSGNPLIKTITTDLSDNSTNYSVIYDNGEIKEADFFVADDSEFLYATYYNFVSRIENGKIVVELKGTRITDSKGNSVEADETVKMLMQELADESEHDLLSVTVIIDNGNYYAFVKLNVNWCTPCILYRYDIGSGKLIELFCWDNVELTGIALN